MDVGAGDVGRGRRVSSVFRSVSPSVRPPPLILSSAASGLDDIGIEVADAGQDPPRRRGAERQVWEIIFHPLFLDTYHFGG